MGVPVRFLMIIAAALAGCNDPFAILPASINNRVDTVEMFAVNGTPLSKPSGYVIAIRSPIRLGLDQAAFNFDFLYRIDPTAGPQFVPYSAIAPQSPDQTASGRSGFLATAEQFAAIEEAQQVGYVVDQPLDLEVGRVFYARSALPNGCFLLIPYYAKIEVLSFDSATRSVKFQILANINCGYRGLEPGLPKR
jgi:hypothetical protein